MAELPYEITRAMIQCFGKSFHYKDNMESFLRSAGVNSLIVQKYRDDPKYVWAKKLISELSNSEDGQITQRKILTELCKLQNLPDENVPDPDAGLDALRKLKRLAIEHDLDIKKEKTSEKFRKEQAKKNYAPVLERTKKLEEIKKQFCEEIANPNRQQAGYALEDILKELFRLSEIEFRKPYKTETEQIDGHFKFEGFDYILEARWRKDPPNEPEINSFKGKVDKRIESTRGLIISVPGFREEVIRQFDGRGSNIIFMDGQDLIFILEGRVDLKDALQLKATKAAQEGKVFISLQSHFL